MRKASGNIVEIQFQKIKIHLVFQINNEDDYELRETLCNSYDSSCKQINARRLVAHENASDIVSETFRAPIT